MAWKGNTGQWNQTAQWGQQSQPAANTWNQSSPQKQGGWQAQNTGAVVRPPVQGGMQGKGGMAAPVSDTLVVSTGGQGMDEVVIRTLVGEYSEDGTNHSRKTYKKPITPVICDIIV